MRKLVCPLLCVIQNNGTPNIFMSQSLELVNVSLYGKKDSADVIKLRIIKWEDYLGGPDVIAVVLLGGTGSNQWEDHRPKNAANTRG